MGAPAFRRILAVAACVASSGATGCGDASGDPLAVLVTEETHGALALVADLPTFPRLVPDEAGGEEEPTALRAAAGVWRTSWDHPGMDGRVIRADVYRAHGAALADLVPPEDVEDAVERVGEAVLAVQQMGGGGLPPFVQDGIDEAHVLHVRARAALDKGHRETALMGALQASDRLREIGPEGVGERLVGLAETSLDRVRMDGSVPSDVLRRGERLTLGAREALEGGDYPRAIQRAFYACQLLGADIH